MIKVEKMSCEQYTKVFDELLERHHIETYDDASIMCKKLKDFAIACLSEQCAEDTIDDIAYQNLNHVASLLDVCSSLFIECDEYYRSKRA